MDGAVVEFPRNENGLNTKYGRQTRFSPVRVVKGIEHIYRVAWYIITEGGGPKMVWRTLRAARCRRVAALQLNNYCIDSPAKKARLNSYM
jgi:hypothetical protein